MRHHEDDHDFVTSGPFNECGIDLPEFSTDRHTAIQCKHATTEIRKRLRVAMEQSSLMPLLSLRYPQSADLDSILETITSLATAEAVTIMWEHSDETASEYRKLLREAR